MRVIPIALGSGPAIHPAEGEHRLGAGPTLTALPPLSLYIHLPWCLRKCPYCDFNSHAAPPGSIDADQQSHYVSALIQDLEAALPQIWGRPVHSIFFGGGTPSLFAPEAIDRLLGDVRARLRLEPACEITLEANPGTFEKNRFMGYARAGVTRLSLGVQSFDDAALQALGRVHDADQARAAAEEAARAFTTWNLDLMYALPGQDLPGLRRDLAQALALAPPHLSLYHLTLEPNTRFATQPPEGLPDEDTAFDMLDHLIEATQAAGLERYEVSAFARPGHRCTHNLNYWRFGDYLGIGAGAHSKLSFPDRIERQTRWRDPATYLAEVAKGRAVSNVKVLTPEDLPFEFMLNGLRLVDGVPERTWVERTGLPPYAVETAVDEAVARGLMERHHGHWRPTPKGLDFLSDLQALFLPAG